MKKPQNDNEQFWDSKLNLFFNSDMFKHKNVLILRNDLFNALILLLVFGWLILAILDEQYRESFVKIAEFGIGCFIGWMMPNPNYRSKR